MKNKTKWIVLALPFIVCFLLKAMRQLYFASIPPIRSDLRPSMVFLVAFCGAVAILFACRCRRLTAS